MRKLRNIFIVTIFTCLIMIITISTSVTYNLNKSAIEEESIKLLESTANYAAENINKRLVKFKSQIDTVANNYVAHYKSLDIDGIERIEHMLDDFTEIVGGISGSNEESIASYIVMNHKVIPAEDGIYPYQALFVKDENNLSVRSYNVATTQALDSKEDFMAWYFGPIENKKGTWSNIYFDEYVNDTIITYSTPIIIDDQVIGVIGLDIRFSSIQAIVEGIQVYETGYAFLMNDSYDYLVHPDFNYTNNLTTIFSGDYAYMKSIFDEKDSGIIKYFFNDKDKIMAFKHLDNGWVVAAAPPYEEVFYFYNDLRNTQILLMSFGILLSVILAGIIGFVISKPFNEIATDIQAHGLEDTKFVPKRHFIYEIDILYKNFNHFIEKLKRAFDDIQTQNTLLEDMVKERTINLENANKMLKASIKELEATQFELVKARKEHEINILIKNIAHNMNTPLGSAIMTYSFLDQMLLKDRDDKVDQALDIIKNNLNRIKRIVDGLNMLTADYKLSTVSTIPLNIMVNDRVQWMRNQFPHTHIEINTGIDETYVIRCYKNMLINMLDILFSYSLQTYEDITSMTLDIQVIKNEATYTLAITDYQIPIEDMLAFYDHGSLSQINMSLFNLDLHLLHAIMSALKGEVHFQSTEDSHVKWIIILPIDQTDLGGSNE